MPEPSAETIFATLSPAEQRVLVALLSGGSNKTIARQLDIAGGTVKVHMKSLFRKAGVNTRLQVVLKLMPLVSTLCGATALLTREQFRAEMAMEAEFSGPLVSVTWGDPAPRPHLVIDKAAV